MRRPSRPATLITRYAARWSIHQAFAEAPLQCGRSAQDKGMNPAPGETAHGRGAVPGIGMVSGLIARTLGPAGRPSVIKDQAGGDIEAPDAETIVARFTPGDPRAGLGASYVRDLVRDQHAAVPDGAATAVVLADAMVRRAVAAMDGKADPIGLVWGIEAARDAVADELGRRAVDLGTKEEIATVIAAAIFDRPLAGVLAEAFDKVGKDGVITVEPAGEPGLELGLSQGMSVDGGYVSADFVTDAERGEAILRDPSLLLVDAEVTAAEDLLPVIDAAAAAGRPLVVLATSVTGPALAALVATQTSGKCATLAAWAQGDQDTRDSVLRDLAVVTGATLVGGRMVGGPTPQLATDGARALGSARKVVASRDRTLIVGGAADEAVLTDRITQIRAEIESAESNAERRGLFTRLARLAGGAATVRAGGATSAETALRVARAERGLRIARLAMDYPIMPGGGAALADVQKAMAKFPRSAHGGRSGDEAAGARIVLESLTAPMRQLAENAGVPASGIDKALKSRKDGAGIDPATGKTVPMRPHAIDVLPVLQAAVTNATSLVVRVLSS
jgi:chaperonin GroEL